MAENDTAAFEGWAILELMGHRRLAGYVREREVAGASFLRLDVPGDGDETYATQLYSPAAVYCITPTTEEAARQVAQWSRPAPVKQWELPAPRHVGPPHVSDIGPDDLSDGGADAREEIPF